ncbi:hypothetical protein CGCF413_v011265 [Colletotrichum fructicola]|nr:hypothetical protein CGCF413_v011265 [Colletotrichum fructicola]
MWRCPKRTSLSFGPTRRKQAQLPQPTALAANARDFDDLSIRPIQNPSLGLFVLFPWAAPTFFSITDSNTSSTSTPFMAFTKDFLINMGSVYPDFLSSGYPSQSVGIRCQITR